MVEQSPVEQIAEGLQRLINEAEARSDAKAERAAERAAERTVARLEPRLDRQDATLRLMWQQMKGNGKVPIDD